MSGGQYPPPGQQYPPPGLQHAGGPEPRPGRNPLGLASLLVGAVIPILGLVHLVVQAAVISTGEPSVLGAVSAVNGVISGLLAIAAIVLGIVAVSRRGLSKTFAAAGIALGAAALVSVIGSLSYGLLIQVMYSF
ncbi:hypothetical protein NVV95_13250 [Herbiconiux sp. CPCC 205716]|uniref:DUF4190 domain-containing protein n=1 Tax=Herbiconiux gentiana TaxID=2970912 RepID=A0ABT2GH10_9MICO|nr:hypothetical protein [Herbiconiux gentiana]MCS5715511.1 hypothetical protein [Herbiconiux gentiana]